MENNTFSNSYYFIPRFLFETPGYNQLSTNAKLLYGVCLTKLLTEEYLIDEAGNEYVEVSVKIICNLCQCCKNTALKILGELDTESGIGLINRTQFTNGSKGKIYLTGVRHAKD
jgi:hypothetical protein